MEVYAEAKALQLHTDRRLVNALVNACARGGEADLAMGVVTEALRAGVALDEFSISTLINALGNAGQVRDRYYN
eukprot:5561088-Pyramimonas_sp.AAC.1